MQAKSYGVRLWLRSLALGSPAAAAAAGRTSDFSSATARILVGHASASSRGLPAMPCTVQAVQLVQLRTMMKPTRTTSVDQWDWPLPD